MSTNPPSRREFLTTTAAGLAGVSLAPAQFRRAALGHDRRSPGSHRRRPQAPHPAPGGRRAQPRPEGRRLREGRRPDRRKDDRRDRAQHLRRRCRGGRLLGHDRHARLHHHAPSPVRNPAAEHHRGRPASRAPGRRRATARWCRTSGRRAGSPIRRTRAPSSGIWDACRTTRRTATSRELVACLSEISEGITCGTDTSQANHTPEHTDAMIKGLMDSGRRTVFDYSGGTNRSAEGIPVRSPRAP